MRALPGSFTSCLISTLPPCCQTDCQTDNQGDKVNSCRHSGKRTRLVRMNDMNEKTRQARLDKLEELVAHQALALDDMSGELRLLHEAHSDLMRRHKALVSRLEAVEDTSSAGEGAPRYEKPPHY